MDYLKSYQEWLEKAVEDKAVADELISVKGDNDAVYDRFYTTLKFGTAGLRGVLGAGTWGTALASMLATYGRDVTVWSALPEETAKLINGTKKNGGRVIAVGTTSCRTLESVAAKEGCIKASEGWTDIFIYPGFTFKVLDGLITNFHLPESTLIMLVSAFAGKDHIMNAYKTAVQEKYRFFSFGDCCFIC